MKEDGITGPSVSRGPWLAPAVACALAGVILVVLLFGHVLRYPVAGLREDDSAAIEAQLQTNQALRDQLARLRSAAIATTCEPHAPGASPRGAAIEPALLPPAPASTPVALPAAGPGRPAGPGTLAGLLDRATVLVLAGDRLGSGFFVSDRDIVTNHHVVGDLRGFVSATRRSAVSSPPASSRSARATRGARRTSPFWRSSQSRNGVAAGRHHPERPPR